MEKINLTFDRSQIEQAQKLADEYQFHIKKASSLANELAKLNLTFKQNA